MPYEPADRRSRVEEMRKQSRRRRRKSNMMASAGLAAVLLVFIFAIGLAVFVSLHKSYVRNALVTHHERVCSGSTNGSSSCKYLVYTDQGVFSDSDSILHFKFNSSDIYGQIQDGHRYDFTLTGYRFPFASHYKNIISLKEDS